MPDNEKNEKLRLLEKYRQMFWNDSSEPHALHTLAESYLALNCFDQAIVLFQRLIEQDVKNASLHGRLADVLFDAGQWGQAAIKYAEASTFDSKDKSDLSMRVYGIVSDIEKKDPQEARTVIREICARFPDHLAFKRELGRLCCKCGDLSEGRKIYEGLLHLPEANGEWRAEIELELAGVLEDMGEPRGVVELLESAIPQLGSEFSLDEAKIQLAENYVQLGRFYPALLIFSNQADSLIPGQRRAEMLLKKAKCYEGLRNYDDAIQCLIEILPFVREYGDADDDWLAKKRIVSDPGFYEQIYAALTRCYEAKGDLIRAKEAFKKEKEYYAKNLARGQ